MSTKKNILIVSLVVLFVSLISPLPVFAEQEQYSYVLMDADSKALLYAENGSLQVAPYHSAKLMSLLLAAEAVESGTLKLDNIVTVSPHANSMQGTQIWLRAGEEVSVSELILSVSAGNANDACVALCEAVTSSEEAFVDLMNKKADELGMLDTHFADATGLSGESYTTACDVAILASELSKYTWLDRYFSAYISYVRGGQTQIVNTNRLVRTSDWVCGMKYYYTEQAGHCTVTLGRKNGLNLVCVIFGESDKDNLFKTAKEKLTIGFAAYTVYVPSRYDVVCLPVKVAKSVVGEVDTELSELEPFIIRKSKLESVSITSEYFDSLTAPINKGDAVGRVLYQIDGETVYAADIVAACDVRRISFFGALKRLLEKFAEL